ncbi:hypothetical protein C7U92_02575 [Bradyrhizobium sp. WBOS7]|uniref:Uncharacterized protein n=1 Tax=Bradyrhizobium betae TaxID=244734 RepID=A0AAE9SSY8_9BRAD|nr:hypothetical protein [Bradyrhizobium sp. WBOS2]MDD1569522.1 hypothetical protein [Bradyrhizobium sp. WBOS1]MDD1575621.1 hypothetical protein [Bradyrhizobium sp. WBOS7]MDD1599790.1 hypothetical protein [Bradyrhizobium sp. WBOS16]UUO35975.1 hypothetical protein DCK84_16335 [Bradyrhizobium sp. WBOS01]UUO42281.1 hypothetical protein DCM75_17090 [Bradyrhizobium sp. WBOS02]UUO56620.1 hypothetical protein DCM79_28880 [Bradyrhizobium sp. WBOS07]UUO66613.1 hypothetical protein DCM83_16345 [Bradyrh
MRLILHLLAGLICALGMIAIGVVAHGAINPVFLVVWTPATWLVRLSNVLCPPMGVRCFLGSVSQGAHHLWFGLCLLGFWWIVMSCAVWPLLRQRRSSSKA